VRGAFKNLQNMTQTTIDKKNKKILIKTVFDFENFTIEKFGKYLLENCDKVFKTYSYCIKDMWGNESYKKVDFNGFDFAKLNLGLSLTLNQDNKNNKIIVYENN
jgi:hypothetical protein